MALPHITPHSVAPYILGGASGAHILVRLWHSSQVPARTPLYSFLLKHTDIILALSSSPVVIWHLAKHHHQRHIGSNPIANASMNRQHPRTAHQLRQVFTALRLGLGLIKRRATAGRTTEVWRLVERLQNVVSEGIEVINLLDPPYIVKETGV